METPMSNNLIVLSGHFIQNNSTHVFGNGDDSSTSDQDLVAKRMAAIITSGVISKPVIHQYNSTYCHSGTKPMKILSQLIAPGASYDSDEQCNEPRLPDEAQNLIVDNLVAWASGPLSSQNAIKFVFGPRGSGKSTMARALCRRLAKKELSAVPLSFFFKQQHPDLGRRRLLISTIAYQLWKTMPAIRDNLELAIRNDPAFIRFNLETQLDQLIIQPLLRLKLEHKLPEGPVVIVLDGLDQCDDKAVQTYILCTFAEAFDTAELPVRLLVFSRAVPYLMDVVAGMDGVGTCLVGSELVQNIPIWHRTATFINYNMAVPVTFFFNPENYYVQRPQRGRLFETHDNDCPDLASHCHFL